MVGATRGTAGTVESSHIRGNAVIGAAGCCSPLLQGVGLSGNNLAFGGCVTPSDCGARCCARPGCAAWTWTNRSDPGGGDGGGAAAAICYLKSAAIPEPCDPDEKVCISWSRAPVPPLPPPPPPPAWCQPTVPCDRGWEKDTQGCCTRLALGGTPGIVAYPHGANLSATSWEDRPYPWGGDMALSDDGTLVHGYFAEYSSNCPMTYGTWYSSTHIRHAVAPADLRTGLPRAPFVPTPDVAIPRAAGNPVLLKRPGTTSTPDGYRVLYTTNQPFGPPVRNCSGRPPARWHREAVYSPGNPMGVNLAWARSLDGPWTVRADILRDVELPYGLASTTNPAAVLLANGTVILAYKTWPTPAVCQQLIGAPRCKAIGIVSTHHQGWNGTYSHRPMGDGFVAVGGDIEDPSLYQDPESGALHLLMHTEEGGGAGGSAHSTDLGKTWGFDVSKHAYNYAVEIVDNDGQQLLLRLSNREEPKLLLDWDGFPSALINQATVRALEGVDSPPPAASGYSGPQSTYNTFTLMQPL